MRHRLGGGSAGRSGARRRAAHGLALGLALFLSPSQAAETIPTAPAAAEPGVSAAAASERKRATEAELEAIARDIKLTDERQGQIRREIEALDRDRNRINEQVLATAGRIQALESQVGGVEAKIGALEQDSLATRQSLAKRRALLGDVLAALQRIGRKPPPAILIRPEDALASVRSAILLGAVLPELRVEADRLAADLQRLVALRDRTAAERDTFRTDVASLAEEKSRLELLMDERRRARTDQQQRLDEEHLRAVELASKAGSMKDLIAKLESEIDSSRLAAEAARKAEAEAAARPPADKTDQRAVTAALHNPGRLQPAVPFADAKGLLPLPANGVTLKSFGDDDGLGGQTKGISIATRAEARVTSPSDGWIVYAGPFRTYGKLLIINGGGGYHVVLAGMDRIDVELGQFVLAGEPVGVMGARKVASTALDSGSTQPVLYVEFRKDNTSVDPTPWWVQSRDEKVRG